MKLFNTFLRLPNYFTPLFNLWRCDVIEAMLYQLKYTEEGEINKYITLIVYKNVFHQI